MIPVKYIDLSHMIQHDMVRHPYDDPVSLVHDKSYASDGYTHFTLTAGTHIGTHMDSPMHMSDSLTYMSQYPVEHFCGNTLVYDVRGRKIIDLTPAEKSLLKEDLIVLFYTGYDQLYGSEDYYNSHPVLSQETAHALIDNKVKIIGLDCPSPDHFPFAIHKQLFNASIFIIENLKNLNLLLDYDKVECFFFPLKIQADASWIRGVARVTDTDL